VSGVPSSDDQKWPKHVKATFLPIKKITLDELLLLFMYVVIMFPLWTYPTCARHSSVRICTADYALPYLGYHPVCTSVTYKYCIGSALHVLLRGDRHVLWLLSDPCSNIRSLIKTSGISQLTESYRRLKDFNLTTAVPATELTYSSTTWNRHLHCMVLMHTNTFTHMYVCNRPC
jgi:hypothetical protein